MTVKCLLQLAISAGTRYLSFISSVLFPLFVFLIASRFSDTNATFWMIHAASLEDLFRLSASYCVFVPFSVLFFLFLFRIYDDPTWLSFICNHSGWKKLER